MIEAGSPNSLFRRGINKNTVKPGMVVVVDGYQARDGSRRANGRDVTLPEGRRLFLGSGGTGALRCLRRVRVAAAEVTGEAQDASSLRRTHDVCTKVVVHICLDGDSCGVGGLRGLQRARERS